MLRTFLNNTAAGYALKALQMTLGLIAIPVLVARIGPDGYGLIVVAGAVLGYFSVFDLGISGAITKFVAQHHAAGDENEVDRVISTSLATFAVIGAVLAIVLLVSVTLGGLNIFNFPQNLRHEARSIFLLTAFLSLFAWARLALEGALKGMQDFVRLNIVIGLGRVLAYSLAIALALFDFSVSAIYLASQIDIFVSLFFMPMLLRRHRPGWVPRIGHVRRATLATIWSFSSWLMLSKIAVLLEYQLDTLLLGIFMPVSAVTAYVVLTYPFRMLQQFAGLAAQAAMPAVSAAASVRNETAVALFRLKGARLHNAFLAITTGTLLTVLEPFIRLWMGSAWLDQVWVAYVATGFQLVWQSNAFVGQVYIGLGHARKPGVVAILTGMINLVLSLIFVGVLGVAGVILGTVIAGLGGVALFVLWCLPDIDLTPQAYLRDILFKGQAPIWFAWLVFFAGLQMSDISVGDWGTLLTVSLLCFLTLSTVAFNVILTKDDRVLILKLFKR